MLNPSTWKCSFADLHVPFSCGSGAVAEYSFHPAGDISKLKGKLVTARGVRVKQPGEATTNHGVSPGLAVDIQCQHYSGRIYRAVTCKITTDKCDGGGAEVEQGILAVNQLCRIRPL